MCKIVVNIKTIEETIDAKCCPFCGGTELKIGTHDLGGGYCSYFAYCKGCGATGPDSIYIRNKKDAVLAWNRRTENIK